VLGEASGVLVPPPIARKLVEEEIDTLVIVPTDELGMVPFAALEVEGKPLVERASILVAPSFATFGGGPRAHRRPLAPAVVVGDPDYGEDPRFELPPLPGARAEALEVGALLGSPPLLGAAATLDAVAGAIAGAPGGPGLVYLATHGRADPKDPLDRSVLWLAGRTWSAREISKLPLAGSRPLVVLSACQTALGKSFRVGTIGLARAWMLAGASSVVMSLWQVDDAATRALMTAFVEAARDLPPDVALRRAMLASRARDPDPAHWASFAVYGVPSPMPPAPAPGTEAGR
jgi:CHAT domain-containing protein